MATAKPKVTLTKKSSGFKAAPKLAKNAAAPLEFALQDNGDDSLTVLGIDAAGNTVDISGVATLAISSDNANILAVDPPVGMTSNMHALGSLGSANVTAVVTWTDGSVGPFTVTLPVKVVAGPAAGVVIQPGTPTIH